METKRLNYIEGILGLDTEDVKEIETTMFNCFQDISIVKEYNKRRY